jgi:hypothetical protein
VLNSLANLEIRDNTAGDLVLVAGTSTAAAKGITIVNNLVLPAAVTNKFDGLTAADLKTLGFTDGSAADVAGQFVLMVENTGADNNGQYAMYQVDVAANKNVALGEATVQLIGVTDFGYEFSASAVN